MRAIMREIVYVLAYGSFFDRINRIARILWGCFGGLLRDIG